MEFFRGTNFDFLGKKWYFLAFSLVFSVAGLLSMIFWHHIPLGVDFKGGTLVYVKFNQAQGEDHIRNAMRKSGLGNARIQRYGAPGNNEFLITLEQKETSEEALDRGKVAIVNSLQSDFGSGFSVTKVEIVGPQVGRQLQGQALRAIAFSLTGMLIYLWFRFELIYGVAAVVAVFHDTLITVGAFSLTNREITLTVIAAILTLVGYSMNDTIVVFDRIRENVRLLRREPLGDIVNKSINQTLSRTVLSSGLTFLTVLSLYVFGGEVLHGFAFALVIGIVIGTYSSIAVAAPMLVAYQDWRLARQGGARTLPAESARKRA